ncbi:DUF4143 domain-containing protein, partial [Brevibacterium paucivorans]|uniref:DUF4143 domain-containing protein n=1 Tax=Brevibacterium paucivorans TaxID=170994 RepID=UPI002155C544
MAALASSLGCGEEECRQAGNHALPADRKRHTQAGRRYALRRRTSGDAAKISKDSALGYRDILSKLWLLDPVPAWFPNPSPFKKLTAAPKHQIFDPGIAAALLGLTPNILASGEPGSWELFGQLF